MGQILQMRTVEYPASVLSVDIDAPADPTNAPGKLTTVVVAGMGTGKTNWLKKYIDTLPPLLTILVVTCRMSLAFAHSQLFGDSFRLYSEPDVDCSTQRRLLCQVQSLHRIVDDSKTRIGGIAYFDVVILDELVTTCDAFAETTTHHGYHARNIQIFEAVVARGWHVLVTDADYEYIPIASRYIDHLRKGSTITVHRYLGIRMPRTIVRHDSEETIMRCIKQDLLDGHRVVLVACSRVGLKDAVDRIVCDGCLRQHEIITFDGEMDPTEKKFVFSDVNQAWCTARLVGYTSVCMIGNSYHAADAPFHSVYILGRRAQGPVARNVAQMCGRHPRCVEPVRTWRLGAHDQGRWIGR